MKMKKIEKKKEIKQKSREKIFLFLMLIGFLFGFISLYLIGKEIQQAKSFCEPLNLTYTVGFPNHYCNGSLFIHYKDGWDFERNFTLNLDK